MHSINAQSHKYANMSSFARNNDALKDIQSGMRLISQTHFRAKFRSEVKMKINRHSTIKKAFEYMQSLLHQMKPKAHPMR